MYTCTSPYRRNVTNGKVKIINHHHPIDNNMFVFQSLNVHKMSKYTHYNKYDMNQSRNLC